MYHLTLDVFIFKARGCVDIIYAGFNTSGVYNINPDHRTEVEVYCDLETEEGGWIVFQKRMDASVGFHRTWEDYKHGFGNPKGNFWLGNENMHRITSANKMTLRVDLEDWNGRKVFARYENFKIGNEKSRYEMLVSGYSGTSGDSLSYHNDMMFSTRDNRDLKHRRRGRQRERQETIVLISKTLALHVHYTLWYISLPSSAKQRREMTKFKVLWRT